MQPIKKRKGLAKKLFGMTPMGMAFNAGAKAFKGMKGLASKASGVKDKIKGAAGKAFSSITCRHGDEIWYESIQKVLKIYSILLMNHQQSLTELTDKTIKETRDAKDAKIRKIAEGAEGTGDAAMSESMGGGGSQEVKKVVNLLNLILKNLHLLMYTT